MRANRLRTALTGFSVAWGIFILILLLAMANSIVEHSEEINRNNDPMRITIWGGTTVKPWKGLSIGRDITFHRRSFPSIVSADKHHIASVSTSARYNGEIAYGSNSVASVQANGIYPEAFTKLYRLMAGRSINVSDINEHRKVVVLSRRYAEQLFPDAASAVGKIVTISNTPFTVIGTFECDFDDSPLMPYTTVMALKGGSDKTYMINVHLKNVGSVQESKKVQEKVVRQLSVIEKFDPDDEGALWVSNRMENQERNSTGNTILNYVMWSIGILSLLTGIIGVSNIMFVSVKERTHEIGVRRAIGAKPRKILKQVILESVALTTCFGYIGIVMGTIASAALTKYFSTTSFDMFALKVDMNIAIEVTLALIIAGALAGFFPALRALKVNPVEALRDE